MRRNRKPGPSDGDLRDEVLEVMGEEWLKERNAHLGGKTPNEAIEEGQSERVREIIDSITYIGIS